MICQCLRWQHSSKPSLQILDVLQASKELNIRSESSWDSFRAVNKY